MRNVLYTYSENVTLWYLPQNHGFDRCSNCSQSAKFNCATTQHTQTFY